LQLTRLESHRRGEVPVWNWYSSAFPGVAEWRAWLREVAGELLRRPGPSKARVVKTNVIEAAQPAERVWFEGSAFGIGRGPDNAIVLPEATITRNHARLRREGESFLLEDLGSAMGTLVNGSKLTSTVPVELSHGDDFVIFPYRFRLEVEREWVPETNAAISETACFPTAWEEFREDCPSGWLMPALNMEPLGCSACLAAGDEFLRALSERLAAPIAQESPGWTAVSEALIELLLLAVIERANRDLAFPFQFSLRKLRRPPRIADEARGVALAATLDLGGVCGALRLFLPFDLLDAMQDQWSGPHQNVLPEHARWKLACSAGHVELDREEWSLIDLGDVLLYTAEPAVLLPGDDRVGWVASWDGSRQVRIQEKLDRRPVMTGDETLASFQDLPLRVQILVDEHEMTVRDAEMLAPGSVLDLDRDPREPVRLAVNGRVVGTGELVEIDGRLGVKILGWSKP
jgi:type III secretion system YscQ/HrcQ family protein